MLNFSFNRRICKRPLSLIALCILAAPITSSAEDTIVQMIKRNASNFAIDGGRGSANAQDVYLWQENDRNANQQWIETDRGNGYYSYQKLNTEHCLDGGNGGKQEQNVYLWSCNERNQNQHWLKVDVGGGHYRLEKRNAPGFSIDGNKRGENAQSIYLYESNDNNRNQHWFFNVVGSTSKTDASNTNNDDAISDDTTAISDETTSGECVDVDSLNELSKKLDTSNECIRVTPGTYHFDADNVGEGKLFSNNHVLQFTGSNNTYLFDGVTFEFDTEIFRQFGREDVNEFHVTGRNNVFKNLVMKDIGNTAPFQTAQAVIMDGADNRVEGFTITTKGSYPYGYGDIFGKGRTRTLNHRKHSGVLIRGDRNHLKGLSLHMRSYGHGIFVQGGHDVLIEDCYVEGELSTVDAVLAERGTGTDADEINFETAWGYNLQQVTGNYHFSLQEDGIRAYSTGNVYGTDESRNTGDITVKNSTVKFMRSGVTLGLSRGVKHVENTTALGTETGFWVGSNSRVINSRGDASVGPLYSEDAARGNSVIELTLLDDVVLKVGDTPTIYLAGDDHNMTLKNGTTFYNSKFELLVGGKRFGHRWLEGSGEEPLYRDADDITFDNQTPYPVVLGDNSDGTDIKSCGSVTDNGRNNSIERNSSCN